LMANVKELWRSPALAGASAMAFASSGVSAAFMHQPAALRPARSGCLAMRMHAESGPGGVDQGTSRRRVLWSLALLSLAGSSLRPPPAGAEPAGSPLMGSATPIPQAGVKVPGLIQSAKGYGKADFSFLSNRATRSQHVRVREGSCLRGCIPDGD
jgi:hypothetical protein